jgi:chromosome segregation ATPase
MSMTEKHDSDPPQHLSGEQRVSGSDRPTQPPLSDAGPLSIDEQDELAKTAPLLTKLFGEVQRFPFQIAGRIAELNEKRDAETREREKLRDEAQRRRELVRDEAVNKGLNQVTGVLTSVELSLELQEKESRKILGAVTELSNQVLALTERVNKLEHDGNRRDNAIAALRAVDDETLTKLEALDARLSDISKLLSKVEINTNGNR